MDDTLCSIGALPPRHRRGLNKWYAQKSGRKSWSSESHFIRDNAKRLAQLQGPEAKAHLDGVPCFHVTEHNVATASPSERRPQLELDLRNLIHLPARCPDKVWRPARPTESRVTGPTPTAVRGRVGRWLGNEESEGTDLARSNVPLPSDSHRLGRRPTLERQDAFRDASTAKAKVYIKPRLTDDDAVIAELYEAGILYDDKLDNKEPFGLNNIHHDEPLYHIRPAKRARRGKRVVPKTMDIDSRMPLHLDLSFTDLGQDSALAPFLESPTNTETSDDMAIQHSPRRSASSTPPLRVIYEIDGTLPSFDVDTSQPPDLVLDTISDYDYCSDTELQEALSQREVHDGTELWVMLGDGS